MAHMVNWEKVHELSGEINPKDAHSVYMYHNFMGVNDAFVAVQDIEGLSLPIHMYPMKLIPLYL